MKTLSEHAVDALNTPEFYNSCWRLDIGHLDALREIYNRYTEERGLLMNTGRHPRKVLRSVTSALVKTKSGRERFRITGTINYPGIINTPCNVFELKEPYRTTIPALNSPRLVPLIATSLDKRLVKVSGKVMFNLCALVAGHID